MKRKISATDIRTWIFCPRAYYLQKIQKMQICLNERILHGILVHKLYKLYFESMNIEKLIKVKIPELIKTNSPHLEKLKIDGKRLQEELTKSALKLDFKTKYGFCSIPKYIEKTFQTEKTIVRIDCIFNTNGSFKVGDIKLNGNNELGTKLQLTAGAIALEKNLKLPVEKGVVIDGNEWNEYEIPITRDLKKLFYEIVEKILKFHSKPELPKIEFNPYKCSTCSFSHLCLFENGEKK